MAGTSTHTCMCMFVAPDLMQSSCIGEHSTLAGSAAFHTTEPHAPGAAGTHSTVVQTHTTARLGGLGRTQKVPPVEAAGNPTR
jgi:hypothetical protein